MADDKMTQRDKMIEYHKNLMDWYKQEQVHDEAVDKKYNIIFNDYLVKVLNIQVSSYPLEHYVDYYKRHKFVLIPANLSLNKQETKPLVQRYKGATETNWALMTLLGYNKSRAENEVKNKMHINRRRDDSDSESDDEKVIIEPNKAFNELSNNCVQALTGENSNLITIDIDYAFKCFQLFLMCYSTSQLCTLTKNGFHFHYFYNPKLRSSKVGKHQHGFDIKNNTAITMPPSYYSIGGDGIFSANTFDYKYFRFNDLTAMPEELVNYINELMSDGFHEITVMNETNLIDKTFLKIIDLLPVSKSDDTGTWFLFGKICSLLGYSVEYFDYFSKKSTKYDYERNFYHYNSISQKSFEFLKKSKLTEQEQKEIAMCKPVLAKWIIEANENYFKKIELVVKDFNHTSVAEYFHTNTKSNFIYKDKDWYCNTELSNSIWKKDKLLLLIELDKICIDFKVYSFFHYNKDLIKIGDHNFKEHVMSELIKYYKNDSIIFDSHKDIIVFKNGKLNLRTGEFSGITPEDYLTKTLDYDWSESINEELINYCNDIYQKIFSNDAEEMKRFIAYCMTGETNHTTNILFNIGIGARNGKSTIAKIMSRTLPIYYHMVGKDTFEKKNSKKDKSLVHIGLPVRFVFLDELDTTALDVNLLKLMAEEKLEVKPLYKEATTLQNHCKLYICSNHSPRFRPDNGLIERGLLVEAKNKFVDDYKGEPNTHKKDIHLIDNFDKTEYKLAWIHLHLPYIIEMYNRGELSLNTLSSNFRDFTIEVDNWMRLRNEWLEMTGNENDRITKQQLADLYNEKFNIRVNERTALDEGKRIGLTYAKDMRPIGTGRCGPKGVFLGYKIIRETQLSAVECLNTTCL